jgi:hypothetical protein
MFGHTNEPFSLSRDVNAVIIPAGEVLILREGTSGFITQALGGSFTVYVEGNLFHIAGADADALGREPVPPPEVPENATDADIESVIWEQLKTCRSRPDLSLRHNDNAERGTLRERGHDFDGAGLWHGPYAGPGRAGKNRDCSNGG